MLSLNHILVHGILFSSFWIGVLNSLEVDYLENIQGNKISKSSEFDNFGFSKGDRSDFHTISFDPNDVRFWLYSDPRNINSREEIAIGHKVTLRNLVPNQQIKILVHGFLGNSSSFCDLNPKSSLKNAYLQNGFRNIICVDWGRLAGANQRIIPARSLLSYPFFLPAFNNVRRVGVRISKLIQFIISSRVVESPEFFHLIGHSLGAHVVGSAGYRIKEATKTLIGRITGLDPAGFTFLLRENNMLNKNSGKFIDIIHVNSDFFGTVDSLGTVDFYANGGRGVDQPHCKNQVYLSIDAFICGHLDSMNYFSQTISGTVMNGCPCKKMELQMFRFPQCLVPDSRKCENPVIFGEYVPSTAKGNYHVKIKLRE